MKVYAKVGSEEIFLFDLNNNKVENSNTFVDGTEIKEQDSRIIVTSAKMKEPIECKDFDDAIKTIADGVFVLKNKYSF